VRDPIAWLFYLAAFIAAVLTVEGVWLLLRSTFGDRHLNRRLSMIRKTGDAGAALSLIADREGGPLSQRLDARFPAVRDTLWAARLKISSGRMLGVTLGLAVFLMLLFGLLDAPVPVALAGGALVGVGMPVLFVQFRAGARRKKFLEQFPNAIDLIARSLQAGHPAPVAIGVVAQQMSDPIGTEFGLVVDEMTYGVDRDQALRNLAERFPAPELMMFVASVQVTRETGGNLAEVFLKLSEVIRTKAQLRKKVMAISAEGRMSCLVVSALPVVVGGAILALRPGYYADVASDPLFWPMMICPPMLLLLGVWTIWRMVNFKY